MPLIGEVFIWLSASPLNSNSPNQTSATLTFLSCIECLHGEAFKRCVWNSVLLFEAVVCFFARHYMSFLLFCQSLSTRFASPEEPCVCRGLGNDLAELEERKTRRSTLRDRIESETPQWSYQSRQERPAECRRMFCDVQIPGITCSRKQRLHVWKSSLSADQVLGFS